MSYFECNYEEFKRRVKQFHDAAPTLNYDELDNMFRALTSSYLHMNEDMWQNSASIALTIASKTYRKREQELNRDT